MNNKDEHDKDQYSGLKHGKALVKIDSVTGIYWESHFFRDLLTVWLDYTVKNKGRLKNEKKV